MPQARARPLRDDERPISARRRRTVTITGHPGPLERPYAPVVDLDSRRPATARRRQAQRPRPTRGAAERVGSRPDRVALWALVLAVFLVLVAATSSRGQPSASPAPSPALSRTVGAR